jgi:hypothetical protein
MPEWLARRQKGEKSLFHTSARRAGVSEVIERLLAIT